MARVKKRGGGGGPCGSRSKLWLRWLALSSLPLLLLLPLLRLRVLLSSMSLSPPL
jgi:hypothetical protein